MHQQDSASSSLPACTAVPSGLAARDHADMHQHASHANLFTDFTPYAIYTWSHLCWQIDCVKSATLALGESISMNGLTQVQAEISTRGQTYSILAAVGLPNLCELSPGPASCQHHGGWLGPPSPPAVWPRAACSACWPRSQAASAGLAPVTPSTLGPWHMYRKSGHLVPVHHATTATLRCCMQQSEHNTSVHALWPRSMRVAGEHHHGCQPYST